MSDFLGNDVGLDENLDLEFENGDFKIVENDKCVCQDIVIAIAESDLVNMFNDDDISDDEIKNILMNVLEDEPRIQFDSVVIQINSISDTNEITYIADIRFNIIGYDSEQNLTFNINELVTNGVLTNE